jgi:SnoaL-like domain
MHTNPKLTRSQVLIFALSGLALATSGFVMGWHLSRRPIGLGHPTDYLDQKGDAQTQVRTAVLVSLRAFASGYVKRDPAVLPAFMEQLFPKDQDILVLGTDSGEWIEGYQRVGDFIANDWRYWGDVRLDVDNAMVSADNEVAWLTTLGTVSSGSSPPRVIRFTAVLTLSNGRWMFRQVQFQWDERMETLAELLRRSIRGRAASSP